jgi:hypothetical protein
MNSSLEEAIKEAYALAPSNEVVLETIELSHPSVGGSLYMIKQRESFDLTLETGQTVTFEPVGFRFALPAAGENGRQDMRLSIDNVDRRISDFVNAAKNYLEPVKVVYRPYLSSDLSAPQMDPPLTLSLQDVTVTILSVAGRATFADILNRKFPQEYYTRKRFPSLGN